MCLLHFASKLGQQGSHEIKVNVFNTESKAILVALGEPYLTLARKNKRTLPQIKDLQKGKAIGTLRMF